MAEGDLRPEGFFCAARFEHHKRGFVGHRINGVSDVNGWGDDGSWEVCYRIGGLSAW